METDVWLEEDFANPEHICNRLLPFFENNTSSRELYRYLAAFGMYRPGRGSAATLRWLKEVQIWDKIDYLLRKYRKKWSGPNVKIFIFPKNHSNIFGNCDAEKKSGLSFPDKMFLFISPLEDENEIEALFIHEYHHICRMAAQPKPVRKYTLMDSLILEGTAEYTVEKILGRKYCAGWVRLYNEEELKKCWHSLIKNDLNVTRDDELHDALLFGVRPFPKLIGYAVGYYLVKNHFRNHSYSEKISMVLSPETVIKSAPSILH